MLVFVVGDFFRAYLLDVGFLFFEGDFFRTYFSDVSSFLFKLIGLLSFRIRTIFCTRGRRMLNEEKHEHAHVQNNKTKAKGYRLAGQTQSAYIAS